MRRATTMLAVAFHDGAGQALGPPGDARVSTRVATPQDKERLRAMFSRASPETIYRRFHIPYQEVPERMLALMLDVDDHDKQFLVAIARNSIVGHAMYARDGGEAEMAIVVEDGYQSRGVGKSLLRELAEDARSRGVEALVGTVLIDNRRMLGLIGSLFTGSRYAIADGLYHFRAPLRMLEPTDVAQTLRGAA